MKAIWIIFFIGLFARLYAGEFQAAKVVGKLPADLLPEVSGVTVSPESGLLWVLNDSGNPAEIYTLNEKGELMARVQVAGVLNIDWEDLTSYQHDGISYLVIADVGDNYARRDRCYLHIVREPKVQDTGKSQRLVVPVERTIAFQYEGGPRDCEAVGVDILDKRVLLLAKNEKPTEIFEVPLFPKGGGDTEIARLVGRLQPFPEPTELHVRQFGRYNNLVTAMDISADGKEVAVLTYNRAYHAKCGEKGNILNALEDALSLIEIPMMFRAEAIAISPDDGSIFVMSEGNRAPIVKVEQSK